MPNNVMISNRTHKEVSVSRLHDLRSSPVGLKIQRPQVPRCSLTGTHFSLQYRRTPVSAPSFLNQGLNLGQWRSQDGIVAQHHFVCSLLILGQVMRCHVLMIAATTVSQVTTLQGFLYTVRHVVRLAKLTQATAGLLKARGCRGELR